VVADSSITFLPFTLQLEWSPAMGYWLSLVTSFF
jgi:hypothetical protein